VHQGDQVRFLTTVELGVLAAQPALGLGDLHALAGAQPDQVGLDYVDNSGLSSRMTGRTEPFPTVEAWPVAVRVHRTMVCARNAARWVRSTGRSAAGSRQ
jgi:hypothetical protein